MTASDVRLQSVIYPESDGELLPLPGPRFFSRLLNVELRVIGDTLRLYDIANGLLLPTPAEERDARQLEAEARRMAEAEVERLRAEVERLRAGQE